MAMVISCKETPQEDSFEKNAMIEPARRTFSDSIVYEVHHDSLPVFPAKIRVVNTGVPETIPYTGIRKIEASFPHVIELDTSSLKIITPGKDSVPKPRVYKLPEPSMNRIDMQRSLGQFTIQHGDTVYAPVIVRTGQPESIPALPMRMKDNTGFNVQYLDMEQGLIDPYVTCVLADRQGNMWFGSKTNGICKYDGYSLIYYTENEGLASRFVTEMIEDRSGNIWVGTGWGLYKYDGKSFTHYHNAGFSPGNVSSICQVNNGDIWIGTWRGLIKYDGVSWTFYTENEGLAGNHITSLYEDVKGSLWIGTTQGVCKYKGTTFTHYTENVGILGKEIRSITEDKNGYLWFGTARNGISMFDGEAFNQDTYNWWNANIMEDSKGDIWVVSGSGLFSYDGKYFSHYSMSEGLIGGLTSITEDRQNNIWVSTWGAGVMKIKVQSFSYFTQFEDLNFGRVNSIVEDWVGNIWFGTQRGLFIYDDNSFKLLSGSEGQFNEPIRSVIEGEDGSIWLGLVGDRKGLYKYGEHSSEFYYTEGPLFQFPIRCLQEDTQGFIWLGTWGNGMIRYDGRSFTCFREVATLARRNISELPQVQITSILRDKIGNIWYGGPGQGVFKYDGRSVIQYTVDSGRFSATSLYEDKNGNLWIGTGKAGIYKYDGHSYTSFTEKKGLCNNSINSITGDKKGNIWVGTERGLSLISPQQAGLYKVTSFDSGDGLKEVYFNENSVCLDSRNRLWWGANEVVTMLDLNTYEINTEPPLIQLNNIQINQERIDFGALTTGAHQKLEFSDVAPFYNYPIDLELPHDLNHLTFNFSAMDWTAPQSIGYRYILVGLDEQWSPLSKENKAEYRNIPPGDYIFQVRAKGKANTWSEALEYPFSILRPWWSRWWTFSMYGLILLLLARYYIKFIISRERIKAEIQIKQVEVDKMHELDQMKSRFFANISHEFRTPLTLIRGPLTDLDKQGTETISLKRDVFGIMKRNTARLQNLINQLLDISRMETGTVKLQVAEGKLESFLRTIIISFLSLAESKKIKYSYQLSGSDLSLWYDADKMEKILVNLISNAFKFTNERGEIRILAEYINHEGTGDPEYLSLIITDSGIGIPSDRIDRIFDRFYKVHDSSGSVTEGTGIGLALTKELVELYRGDIKVKSIEGEGTTFTLKIPVARDLFREDERIFLSEESQEQVAGEHYQPSETKPDIPVNKVDDKNKPVILIVEDNPDLTQYIAGNLERQYRIVSAGNGKQGFELAVEQIPDLVISDLMMPVMDGMEMCGLIKEDERTSHIPVIMLTARADRVSKLEGLQIGADDYIIKPFDAEELQVRVKNLIEQRRRLREKFRKDFAGDHTDIEAPYDDLLIQKLMNMINKQLDNPEFNVDQMSGELNVSRTQLYRKVNAITGHAPKDLLRTIRLKKAVILFDRGERNISQVMYQIGFNNHSYFAKCFREQYKVNPSEYLKKKTR